MASLTLKNVPESLLRSLRRAARQEGRSLNREVLRRLEASVRGEMDPRKQRRIQLETWRKLAGRWVSDVDAETEARRIVQSRTPGREVDF